MLQWNAEKNCIHLKSSSARGWLDQLPAVTRSRQVCFLLTTSNLSDAHCQNVVMAARSGEVEWSGIKGRSVLLLALSQVYFLFSAAQLADKWMKINQMDVVLHENIIIEHLFNPHHSFLFQVWGLSALVRHGSCVRLCWITLQAEECGVCKGLWPFCSFRGLFWDARSIRDYLWLSSWLFLGAQNTTHPTKAPKKRKNNPAWLNLKSKYRYNKMLPMKSTQFNVCFIMFYQFTFVTQFKKQLPVNIITTIF